MQQAYFEFQTPPRLLAGALALEHIPHELRLLGAQNSAPKLRTAAMTWLSVTEEMNKPMAMQLKPYR